MARKHLFLTILSMVFLTILLFGCSSTPTPDPSIVWSDDFEDGDTEGWELNMENNIFVNEGVMAASLSSGTALHESSVSSGTWSFDLFFPEGKITTYFFCMSCDDSELFGYGITAQAGVKPYISIQTLDNGNYKSNVARKILDSKLTGWKHFDITRDDYGNSKIFLDEELVLEYKDDLSITPQWFIYEAHQPGPGLDNLVVRNQVIDIQPAE